MNLLPPYRRLLLLAAPKPAARPTIQLAVVTFPAMQTTDGQSVAPQYILAHALLARYWGRQDWLQLDWLMHCFRGQLPIDSPEKECDRCGRRKITHPVQELDICKECIVEFINSKTVQKVQNA